MVSFNVATEESILSSNASSASVALFTSSVKLFATTSISLCLEIASFAISVSKLSTAASLAVTSFAIAVSNSFSFVVALVVSASIWALNEFSLSLTVLVNEITCRGTNFQRQYQEGNQIVYGSKNIVVNIPEP